MVIGFRDIDNRTCGSAMTLADDHGGVCVVAPVRFVVHRVVVTDHVVGLSAVAVVSPSGTHRARHSPGVQFLLRVPSRLAY